MTPSGLDFMPLRDPAHWEPYHEIRRRELIERYRPGHAYQRDHPDEMKPEYLPHVLLLDGRVVGTMRIDLFAPEHAGFRLIAVLPELRNRGIGGWMMTRAEAVAASYGRRRFVINASQPAVAFYERHGYRRGDWHDVLELHPDNVRLGKVLGDG